MLTKKQIKFIDANRENMSAEKISKELNVPAESVQKYLNGNSVKKSPFYFYLILFLIPILFFILLEAGLRIFNYGYDLSMWVSPSEGKLMLNPDVARRYFFSVKNAPSSIEDIFDAEKKPNAFRVFVLGESSAAGYPYMPMGSFSRYIRKRLELTYPQKQIEVVNIGLTAVNSYTVRDFAEEVAKQHPDLILVYTGHNEYYGALGVGSLESFGKSPALINFFIGLNKFKTTQLIRNILGLAGSLFTGNDDPKSGTLMSRMAKEQSIPFGSDNYRLGIEQFENNMRSVIKSARDKNIPVIIGTLVSNLKDQKPFISAGERKYPPAQKVFDEAEKLFGTGDFKRADSLYRFAKDLDALRFRAPEAINRIIKKFGTELKVPVVDLDSAFNAASPNGIVGDNLMTDHLHPTLNGYHLMGKLFFNKMTAENCLPKDAGQSVPFDKQDEATLQQLPFSQLDSTIAVYRIKLLKNDWPYISHEKKIPEYLLITPKTYSDTLAFQCVTKGLSWVDAHQKAVDKYLGDKNIDKFLEELEILIYQYPIVTEYYGYIDKLGVDLLQAGDFNNAYTVFLKRHQLKPNDLSAKWLGTIDLKSSRVSSAIQYLEESVRFNPSDLQALYNLAGAYAINKEYGKSFEAVSKVLNSEPDYPGASELLRQLQGVMKR